MSKITQSQLKKQLGRKTTPTRTEVGRDSSKGAKMTVDGICVAHLEYVFSLSKEGRRDNQTWKFLKKRLIEMNHWKKAYSKGKL